MTLFSGRDGFRQEAVQRFIGQSFRCSVGPSVAVLLFKQPQLSSSNFICAKDETDSDRRRFIGSTVHTSVAPSVHRSIGRGSRLQIPSTILIIEFHLRKRRDGFRQVAVHRFNGSSVSRPVGPSIGSRLRVYKPHQRIPSAQKKTEADDADDADKDEDDDEIRRHPSAVIHLP